MKALTKMNQPLWKRSFFNLQNEMNDFFDNLPFDYSASNANGSFIPKLEMKETDKNYIVSAELPGMKENDIHVTLKNNTLYIQGEKKYENTKDEKGFHTTEFSYGRFMREIPFSAEVNMELANANYKDGILTVNIEKKADSASTRKLTINRG